MIVVIQVVVIGIILAETVEAVGITHLGEEIEIITGIVGIHGIITEKVIGKTTTEIHIENEGIHHLVVRTEIEAVHILVHVKDQEVQQHLHLHVITGVYHRNLLTDLLCKKWEEVEVGLDLIPITHLIISKNPYFA